MSGARECLPPSIRARCFPPANRSTRRLYAREGIHRVIESLPAVLRQLPDLVYLIVGEGADCPKLEQLVASHGFERTVPFAGAAGGLNYTRAET